MTKSEFNQKVDAFILRHIDKIEGYPAGQYVGECLSEAKIYMKELWGFNPPSSGVNSAYGYWTNFPAPLGEYFDKIANTPTGVPQKGDIVIWKAALAGSKGYGHIAIATGKGDANNFEAFGQNWGGKNAHHVTYDYKNVYGWLRPKNIDDAPPTPPPAVDPKDEQIKNLQRELGVANTARSALEAELVTTKDILESNVKQIGDLQTLIANNQTYMDKQDAKIAGYESTIAEIKNQNILDLADKDKQIEALKSETVSNLTWGQLWGLIWAKFSNKTIK